MRLRQMEVLHNTMSDSKRLAGFKSYIYRTCDDIVACDFLRGKIPKEGRTFPDLYVWHDPDRLLPPVWMLIDIVPVMIHHNDRSIRTYVMVRDVLAVDVKDL